MTDTLYLHSNVPPEDIHPPFSFVFADNTERLNYIGLNPSDVSKLAYVELDQSVWVLTNIDPIVWKQWLTDDSGTNPIGPALGDLYGEYPNPAVVPDSHNHTPGVSIPAYPTSLPPEGPAGGHLRGSYPNPLLSLTGVTSGVYSNATLTIDSTGRITSAISNPLGETNKGVNLGSGLPIYSHKSDTDLHFHTLVATLSSGLDLTINSETLNLDTPGLAKLDGADFTGPVSCPNLECDSIVSKNFYSPLYNAGSGNVWVPDARDGLIQRKEVSVGTLMMDSILFAQPGMKFTFFVYQADQVLSGVNFAPAYKFGKDKIKTLSSKAYTTDVIKVTVMSPLFYLTEIIQDVG